MQMDKNTYIDGFMTECRELGIDKGDIVYISSDVTRLTMDAMKQCSLKGKSGRDGFFGSFVDALKDLVGPEGTLLFPVFTWSFCRGIPYDVKKTQGEVGALGNWVLNNRDDFSRTEHPLYSFMVWGRDAQKLVSMHNLTAWGDDSPFAYLLNEHGKNLLIDISLEGCFTFAHFVEESIGIPVRYYKDFTGEYVTSDGVSETRTYTMFVRDLDIDSRQVTPDDCLVRDGVARMSDYRGMELQVVDLHASYPFIEKNFREDNGDEWYDFMGYTIDWAAGQTHPDETRVYKRR